MALSPALSICIRLGQVRQEVQAQVWMQEAWQRVSQTPRRQAVEQLARQGPQTFGGSRATQGVFQESL